jgi:hypothetical protein
MSSIFDDHFTVPDGSRITAVVVDEGSLAEAYRTDVAARHAIEAKNEAAEVDEFVVEAEEFRPKQEG